MRYPVLIDTEVNGHLRSALPEIKTLEIAFLAVNGWFFSPELMNEREGVRGHWYHKALAPLPKQGVSFEQAIRLTRNAQGGEVPLPEPAIISVSLPATDNELAKVKEALRIAIHGLVEIAKTTFGTTSPVQTAQGALRKVEHVLGRSLEAEAAPQRIGYNPSFRPPASVFGKGSSSRGPAENDE